MRASRWALVLLAGLAGIVGFLLATREPATADQAGIDTASPSVPPTPATTAATMAVPEPASAAGRAVPLPTTAPVASGIGSEGYGAHIERAHAANDATAAWAAVRWLRQCATNEGRRSSAEALRNEGVAPEMMTELMVEADADARRCQTVTAHHHALLPELAARAMRASVPEAAAAYARAVAPDPLTPAEREEVADAMRRDARSGHAASLEGAVLAHEGWGLSDTERLAYLIVYSELAGRQGQAARRLQGAVRFKNAPTPSQQQIAGMAAQDILARVRAGRPR